MTREFHVGDIVRHFKRQYVDPNTPAYLYRIVAFATHTETAEPDHGAAQHQCNCECNEADNNGDH